MRPELPSGPKLPRRDCSCRCCCTSIYRGSIVSGIMRINDARAHFIFGLCLMHACSTRAGTCDNLLGDLNNHTRCSMLPRLRPSSTGDCAGPSMSCVSCSTLFPCRP